MRVDFSDGSFMLSWEKCRAWYNSDGALKGAEYKRTHKGFPLVVAVSIKHIRMRGWLEKQGKHEAYLIEQGILKRKNHNH